MLDLVCVRDVALIASSLATEYRRVVVVSFGGTDLLLRAFCTYAGSCCDKPMIFFNSVDVKSVSDFLRIIPDKDVLVIVASISGDTAEVALYMRMAVECGVTDRLVVITDTRRGVLSGMVPPGAVVIDMGHSSRLSMLNCASCFVAAMLGMDVVRLVRDVEFYLRFLCNVSDDLVSAESLMVSDHCLIMPKSLCGIGDWFCHVWGEYVATSRVCCLSYAEVMHGKVEVIKKLNSRYVIVADDLVGLPTRYAVDVMALGVLQLSTLTNMLGQNRCVIVELAKSAETDGAAWASAIGFFAVRLGAAYGAVKDKASLNAHTASCKAAMMGMLA